MNSRAFLLVILVVGSAAWAQKPVPPSSDELAAITTRGKKLTEYDRAAHAAISAVKAIYPTPGKGPVYVGQQTSEGWVFDFGHWDADDKSFLTGYRARQDGLALKFIVQEKDLPEGDPGVQTSARAIETAMRRFQAAKRPYSIALIPSEAQGFYVYIYPAQSTPAVYPLGGDVRFKISSDGKSVLEERQMHRAIIEIDNEKAIPKGTTLAGGTHSHILSDIPEDTDVFHVLRQEKPVPEAIGTKHFVYEVQTDGSIKLLKK